ncbi:unnamed protein product [Timema podura]|uniref:Uncharacterized protein n=1 Tax=Timema podura TaxID=61482 RepID=A0ABN7PN39_TIMPD|nr:unnamed protein product [Timema podura]
MAFRIKRTSPQFTPNTAATEQRVLQSSSLVKLGSSAVTGEVSEYPRREVPLPSRPSHFAVSCDQSYLVVHSAQRLVCPRARLQCAIFCFSDFQGWEQQADQCLSVLLLPKHCVLVVYKLPVRLSEPFPFKRLLPPLRTRHLSLRVSPPNDWPLMNTL